MKRIIALILFLYGLHVQAQISGGTLLPTGKYQGFNKSVIVTGKYPADGKAAYFDATNLVSRAFTSVAEANSFIPINQRPNGLTVLINTGGAVNPGSTVVLNGVSYLRGEIIAGTNTEYWYRNGVQDTNLVAKLIPSTIYTAGNGADITGTLISTNYPVMSSIAALRAAVSPNIGFLYKLRLNGTVGDYTYNASDSVSVDDSVMVIHSATGHGTFSRVYNYIDPLWFGAIPDDGVDDSYPMQKAINFAINSPIVKQVLITRIGRYQVHDLIGAKYSGGQSQQCTFSIVAPMNSNGLGVSFYNSFPQSATIHLQQTLGVDLVNISFEGIGADINDFANALDATWAVSSVATGSQALRSNKKAPYAAVVVDDLYAVGAYNCTYSSTTDYYPGVPLSYYTNTNYAGSTNINMNNCVFSRMYVGVAEGLSGAPNGEGIHINGGFGIFVAYQWVAGQLQSRENTIEHFYFIFGQAFITNYNWGTGIGDLPTVSNSNINYLKYMMLQGTGNFSTPRFKNGYSEGIWSIGANFGSTPTSFDGWNLTMLPNDLDPAHLVGRASVIFQGGMFSFRNANFQAGNYYAALPFNCTQVEFDNVYMESGLPINVNTSFFNDNISFHNVHFFGAGKNFNLTEGRNVNALDAVIYSSSDKTYLLPGSKITDTKQQTFERIGNKFDKIQGNPDVYNSGYTISVNTATQSLSFTAANSGIFQAGDVIYTTGSIDYTGDPFTANGASLGYVSNITGSVVTLSNIPAGIINGTSFQMYIWRIPRWVDHEMGTVTSGSNVITSVISSVSQNFLTGDRINGTGIIPGTWVVSATSTTITLSTNATASNTFVELSDARVKMTANTTPFPYFGAYYNYSLMTTIWFSGDELLNGSAGTPWKWYVTTGGKMGSGTPPTFQPIGEVSSANLNSLANTLRTETGTLGAELTGTPFSTALSNGPAGALFDHNTSTFIVADGGGGGINYIGLDLSSTYVLTRIRVRPRDGLASRMIGRLIQGSNTSVSAGFSTLYTIPSMPESAYSDFTLPINLTAYRYLRIYDATTGIIDAAEFEFYGYNKVVGGSGDVSSIETSSLDNQLSLFSSTTGKVFKKFTGTGLPIVSAGVMSALSYGANGTYLKMVGGSLNFVNDSALIPTNGSLGYPTGVLQVMPQAPALTWQKSTTVTATSYTADELTPVILCNASGTLTITLPTSFLTDTELTIKNFSASNVILTPMRAGEPTTMVQYVGWRVHWDGTSWFIIYKN